MATGCIINWGARCAYLADFLDATPPAFKVARLSYEEAKVSGHVASQTRGWPELQGTRVMPSGLWPSEHERPGGSSLEGIPAVESERFMISLRDACRECLPSLFRQHSPWRPSEETSAPQNWQWWGAQMAVPSLRPTAIRSEGLSKRRPTEEIGRACNQAPAYYLFIFNTLRI